jgi:hypothetical protein
MVRFATIAVVLVLLAAVPAAAKGPVPPPALRGVHVVSITAAPKRTALRSCAAQRARIARKLAPVACEQPPRSQLQLANSLKHAGAAIAALLGG